LKGTRRLEVPIEIAFWKRRIVQVMLTARSIVQVMLTASVAVQEQARTHTHTVWPESVSELYRPSDRCLSAKLVPSFADRVCHVVSVTDPSGRILGF
jgi:hypothetical protein